MSIDDVVAFVGLCCFVVGVYLWIGLPPALIVLGVCLMFIGVKLELPKRSKGGVNEPD